MKSDDFFFTGPFCVCRLKSWSVLCPQRQTAGALLCCQMQQLIAAPVACQGLCNPALCRQLLAAPPLPTCHSTGTPKLTSQRGGELARWARTRTHRRSTARPRTTRRCGPPTLSSGYVACLRLLGAGPPRRTQRSWAAGGLRGSLARRSVGRRARDRPSRRLALKGGSGRRRRRCRATRMDCGASVQAGVRALPSSRLSLCPASGAGGLHQRCPATRGMCASLRLGANRVLQLHLAGWEHRPPSAKKPAQVAANTGRRSRKTGSASAQPAQ